MSKVVTIIQGTDRTISVLLQNSNGTAFDLSGVTAIKALFKKANDSEALVEATLAASEISVSGSNSRGEIAISLSATKTALLRAGSRLSWEIEITKSGLKYVTQFVENLDVFSRLTAE